MTWLRIEGRPSRQFYRSVDDVRHLVAGEARHELLLSAGTVRSDIDGETPNATVILRNDAGQCARIFAIPPLGEPAQIVDASGVRFSGFISSVELDTDCRVTIES